METIFWVTFCSLPIPKNFFKGNFLLLKIDGFNNIRYNRWFTSIQGLSKTNLKSSTLSFNKFYRSHGQANNPVPYRNENCITMQVIPNLGVHQKCQWVHNVQSYAIFNITSGNVFLCRELKKVCNR